MGWLVIPVNEEKMKLPARPCPGMGTVVFWRISMVVFIDIGCDRGVGAVCIS
jgi:hypothetical protein